METKYWLSLLKDTEYITEKSFNSINADAERVFEKSGSFHGVGCPTEAKGGQAMEATTPAYPTRLSNTQWATLAAYFAADSQLGRPRNTSLPAVVEAILYVLRAGCPWRMLPREFPPWQTVYGYFPPWRDQGSWKRIHRYLRALGTAPVKRPSCPGWPSPIRSRCRWAASPTGQEALMAAALAGQLGGGNDHR